MSDDQSEEKKKDDEFRDEAYEALQIDLYNLIEEARNVPNQLQRYTDMHRSLLRRVNKAKRKYQEVFREKVKFYTSGDDIRWNSGDARRMAECDAKTLRVKEIVDTLEEDLKFVSDTMWNLREKQKSISSIIQLKKLEDG